MDIASLRGMLVANELSLTELVNSIYAQAEAYQDYNIWIYLLPKEEVLKKAAELEKVKDKAALPLYGSRRGDRPSRSPGVVSFRWKVTSRSFY